MKPNLGMQWIAALFFLGNAGVNAGPVGPLTTFTAGTQAKASEVNGNFSAVKTAVDDNAARIGALETGAASPNVTGNITLVPSTAAAGNILKGTTRFIHNFGSQNTFVGVGSGNLTLGAAATGNTGMGFNALLSITSGNSNTANGLNALSSNMSGNFNTASGMNALTANTTGSGNTASGVLSLSSNTNGVENTALGSQALRFNISGGFNTALGRNSLAGNTIGGSNTAGGATALASNTDGSNNTAFGANALGQNTTGDSNIAIGFQAGSSLTTGNNNIAIDNIGVAGESATTRIGSVQTRAFIAGIRGVTTAAAAIPVLVDTNGQLGTASSSQRVKDDISEMGEASRVLMKLRPVTFYYKADRTPDGRVRQYGLVAEEVAKVAPELVASSAGGEIESVYYQFLAPMLLNEVQRQQRTIEAQEARIAALEMRLAEIAELKAGATRTAGAPGR